MFLIDPMGDVMVMVCTKKRSKKKKIQKIQILRINFTVDPTVEFAIMKNDFMTRF